MPLIKICGKLADKLFSRGFGRRDKKCITLRWVEALYLSEKGIIDEDFRELLKKASSEVPDFDVRFLVYRDLRDRGYVLTVQNEHFAGKKSYSLNFYPCSDMELFEPREFLKRDMPFVLSIVDGDGDITYYLVDIHEPRGKHFDVPEKKVKAELYGKRYFVLEDIRALEEKSYGRSEGLFGHLSVWEANYLMERGLLEPLDIQDSPEYRVYRDLRNRGLIVKSGFKYGTHFRVYENSMEEHSKYLVHVIRGNEEMQKVSRAVRVAHGVRKTLLLAYINGENIFYFKVSWIKP